MVSPAAMRALVVVCAVVIVLSTFTSIVVLYENGVIENQLSRLLPDNYSTYNYIIYLTNEGIIKAKNGLTGAIDYSSDNFADILTKAATSGNNIYVMLGNYTLTSDVIVYNKINSRISSDGAIITSEGNKIIIRGDEYSNSQYNLLSGLVIVNGTVRIENSFRTTLSDMIFKDSEVGLEFANTNTWSEGTKIENIHFVNCTQAIVFRTPNGDEATGSYANTEINRCYFNIPDDSVGITVEPGAEYSDSQMQNVRIWMGEYGERNQTGILVQGTMKQTMLSGVVFESFANYTLQNVYAIDILNSTYAAPILAGGVTFLGNWTARIHNPFNKWVYGLGGVFKQDPRIIDIGVNSQYGQVEIFHNYPLTIADLKTKINIAGTFANNERITIRFRLEFVDHAVSKGIEVPFNATTTEWLDEEALYEQFPAQNVIWAILVDAKTTAPTTNANVTISVYGATT